ncbi:MAG: AAA family ATPase [Polyangiales bacterium]
MIYTFEDFEFDTVRLELRREGAAVKVEPVLLRVLALLVRDAGRLVTKDELWKQIWEGRNSASNVISLAVARLRKALRHGRDGSDLIVTVHGLGYRFVSPVQRRDADPGARKPARVAPRAKAPFVGRTNLLAELRQHAADAFAGRGRVCIVLGEPGIGKSHLVSTLVDELASHGAQVAWGHCRESGITPPLYPWLQLIRRVLDSAPERTWDEALGPTAAELREVLRASESPVTLPAGGAAPRPARLSNVGVIPRVMVRAAELSPRVLVLEDLHRADAASLDVLSLLLDELERARILVLATAREPMRGRDPRPFTPLPSIIGHRSTERFVLHPLSEDEVLAYVGALFDDESGRLGRAVFAKSRGNPFFMAELARQLRRDGATTPEQLELPDAALDILRQHVDALDDDTRDVLTTASVIGVQFELSVLLAVAPQEPSAVARALDEAIAARVLVTTPESRATFSFRHQLLQEVLYEAIPAPERRRRHLELGRMLEHRAARTHLPVAVSELAEHFYRALPETDLEKVVRYCDEAAKVAYRAYALGDVARHMKQALAALALLPAPSLSQRIDLLFRLALYTRGPATDTYLRAVHEVVRLAREGGDARMLVRGARLLNVHPELGALPGATEALEHALTIIPPDEPWLRAAALAALATTAPRAYCVREVRACFDEAEMLARSAERERGLRGVLTCRVFSEGGDDAVSAPIVQDLERLSTRPSPGAPFIPLFLAMYRTMRALRTGDRTAIDAAIEEGLARARALRHAELLWHFGRYRALSAIDAGRTEHGRQQLEALHAASEARSLLGAATFCAFDRVVVLPELGVPLRVDDALRGALARQAWDPPGLWALKARTLASAGLVDEARAALAAVRPEQLRALPPDSQRVGTLAHLARAALAIGSRAYTTALEPLLAPFDAHFPSHASFASDGSVAQLRGMLAAARGAQSEARSLLEWGVRRNDDAGLVLRDVEARLALAAVRRTDNPDAARQLAQRAQERSAQHGLARMEAQAGELLAELGPLPSE